MCIKAVLLWFGDVGDGEIAKKLIVLGKFRTSCIKVLLEGFNTRLINSGLLLEVGMNAIKTEVDVQLELKALHQLLA